MELLTFEEQLEEYWKFAKECFDTKPFEAVFGLMREVKELEKEIQINEFLNKEELEEFSDIQFYLIYILRKRGYSIKDLILSMNQKLEVLKTRKWEKDETGCYSHIKD